jgi:hypothetical protein
VLAAAVVMAAIKPQMLEILVEHPPLETSLMLEEALAVRRTAKQAAVAAVAAVR